MTKRRTFTPDDPPPTDRFGADTVLRDHIAARAYELFLERGSTHGHDIDDWLRAEQETLAHDSLVAAV